MSNKSTRERGNEAEELAAAFLESKGYTILERNYFFERAEVDIVAYDQEKIIFAEVKMRSGTRYGRPEDYVSDQKIQLIYKAAEAWLYERRMDGSPVRFDVISIVRDQQEAPAIKHFEDAFHMRR